MTLRLPHQGTGVRWCDYFPRDLLILVRNLEAI